MVPESKLVGIRLQIVLHLDVAVRSSPQMVAQEPDRHDKGYGPGAVFLDDLGERAPIAGVDGVLEESAEMLQDVGVTPARRLTAHALHEGREVLVRKPVPVVPARARDETAGGPVVNLAVRQEQELVPGVERDQLSRCAPVRHRADPSVVREDALDEALAQRCIVQPALLLAREQGMRLHDRACEHSPAHAGRFPRHAVHLDPRHAAARGAALEDVTAQRPHVRRCTAGDCKQRIGDVGRGVGHPHGAGRVGIAGEPDGRAGNAEARQRLGAPGNVLEATSQHAGHVAVVLVPAVVAHRLAEQTATDADGDALRGLGDPGGGIGWVAHARKRGGTRAHRQVEAVLWRVSPAGARRSRTRPGRYAPARSLRCGFSLAGDPSESTTDTPRCSARSLPRNGYGICVTLVQTAHDQVPSVGRPRSNRGRSTDARLNANDAPVGNDRLRGDRRADEYQERRLTDRAGDPSIQQI